MIRWRIYYDDRSTYDPTDGEWEDAPMHGVVCVVVEDPTGAYGRWINSGYGPPSGKCEMCGCERGNEFYVKYPDSDQPFATPDLAPFLDKVGMTKNEADKAGLIKYGRMVDQEEWVAINVLAAKDPDFDKGSPRRRRTDW